VPAPTPTDPDQHLRLVRDVTANFFFWQGLRWVPMGVGLIVFALAAAPGVPLPNAAREVVPAATMLVALWLSTTVATNYYRRTFGDVRGLPGLHAKRDTVKWLVAYPLMFGSMILDARLAPPVFVSAIVFAAGIVAYRQSTGRGRVHYLFAAAILALFGLLPLTGVVPTGKALFGPFLGLLGAIYVVSGALDHLELTRILRPPAGDEDDTSGARHVGGDVRAV
jgi:hypothetical protein